MKHLLEHDVRFVPEMNRPLAADDQHRLLTCARGPRGPPPTCPPFRVAKLRQLGLRLDFT